MLTTLGGRSQFIKQATIFTEVIGRLKNKAMFGTALNLVATSKNNPDIIRILEASDLSLRNQQEHLFSVKDDVASLSKEIEKHQRNVLKNLGAGYNKVFEKAYRESLRPLIGTDNYMAKLGWLSLYLDGMQEKGYSVQEALASEVDLEVVSRANHLNSVVQNASDSAMQGGYSKSLFKYYQPMMGFSLNSLHNYAISLSKLKDSVLKGDVRGALRYGTEATMNLLNAALFVWVSWFTRRIGMEASEFTFEQYIKMTVDDEDRREELLKEVAKEFDKRKLVDNARTWNYAVNDLLFRGIFSDATTEYIGAGLDALGFQEFMYGREELEQAGYSYNRFTSSNTPYLSFMDQWLPIMGVTGMGISSIATSVDNVVQMFDTHEKYIKDTRAVPYADGSGVHVDLGLLDEEGIQDYGIPDYLRASQFMAGIAGMTSLFGLSDQTVGTMVRNIKIVSKNLAQKERGHRRTGDWEKTLMRDIVSFHEVNVDGVKVELSPAEAKEARESYLESVEQYRGELNKIRSKAPQSLIEEETASLARATTEAGIIRYKMEELKKGLANSIEEEVKDLRAFRRTIKAQAEQDRKEFLKNNR